MRLGRYIEGGATTELARSRAEQAAFKYASKQHRFRAETIVHTELAYAYNAGADMGVKRAIREGLMGRCRMIWRTAGTNRVCSRCMELRDHVVGYTDESGVQIPPKHPRCRCTIEYDEIAPPSLTSPRPAGNVQPATTDALVVPPTSGIGSLTIQPRTSRGCRSFDELKIFWADYYNVKFADAVLKLDFEAVSQACQGVEAVLKEFLPAANFLTEFDVQKGGIMSTARGAGKIYFNPTFFLDAAKLKEEIEKGCLSRLYPKNMTIFGAGAHEAGHIIEDWLIKKYGTVHTPYRPLPRRLVNEAYQSAILMTAGRGKSLEHLTEEIATYAMKNSSECLASAISDYMTNGIDSACLSVAIWQRLKEELAKMIAPSDFKLWQHPIEDIKRYCLFKDGCITGVKENAPADFKKDYDNYKEQNETWEAKGIDV